MKRLVNFRCYVSVNGEKYCDTSSFTRVRYADWEVGDEVEEIINDWPTAIKVIDEHKILNARTGETLWKGKPTIIIHYGENYQCNCTYKEKEFKSLKYKWVAKPIEKIYTIKDLADELPAEQFCDWIKDQNVAISLNLND